MGLFGKLKDKWNNMDIYRRVEDAPVLPPDLARGLAMGAIHAAEGGLAVNVLTTEFDARQTRSLAGQMWGVTDPSSAVGALDELISRGGRGYYDVLKSRLDVALPSNRKEMGVAYLALEADIRRTALAAGLDPGTAWNAFDAAFALRYTDAELLPNGKPASTAAWDAARVVHAAKIFIDAGYLRPEDAWPRITRANTMVRSTYRSWAEFGDAFVVGRALWVGGNHGASGVQEVADSIDTFRDTVNDLINKPTSPWAGLAW